jgi:hypothetical protein
LQHLGMLHWLAAARHWAACRSPPPPHHLPARGCAATGRVSLIPLAFFSRIRARPSSPPLPLPLRRAAGASQSARAFSHRRATIGKFTESPTPPHPCDHAEPSCSASHHLELARVTFFSNAITIAAAPTVTPVTLLRHVYVSTKHEFVFRVSSWPPRSSPFYPYHTVGHFHHYAARCSPVELPWPVWSSL